MSERPPRYSILDLATAEKETIRQAAKVLVEGFEDAWPTEEEALEEVQEALGKDRICRVALGEDGTVLGWVGGLRSYGSTVWELHPLVVRPDLQSRGFGSALVVVYNRRDARRQRMGKT